MKQGISRTGILVDAVMGIACFVWADHVTGLGATLLQTSAMLFIGLAALGIIASAFLGHQE